jgi:hypothetical protein
LFKNLNITPNFSARELSYDTLSILIGFSGFKSRNNEVEIVCLEALISEEGRSF